jgi:hypothetical protein
MFIGSAAIAPGPSVRRNDTMTNVFATAYDQNPARRAAIMNRKRNANKPLLPSVVSIHLLVLFAVVTFCGYLVM